MKKIIRTICICLIVFVSICVFSKNYAISNENIVGTGTNWIENVTDPPITTPNIWEKLKPIASILMSVATCILVILYMYLGIKYMMTDPNGKADIKQKLLGLVVSTIVIYGAMGIFTIIVNLMNGVIEHL